MQGNETDGEGVKVSWVYHLSREELVSELEARGLRISGSVSVLRQRLVEELRGRPSPKMMSSNEEESVKGGTPQVGPSQRGPTTAELNFPPSLFNHPRAVPMEIAQKWGVKFSSQEGSVSDFLFLLEERREAYGLTHAEMLTSLPALLEGTPLLWYRLHRHSWRSWEDFILEFREEFEEPDYQERLAEEIRQRTQGPRESISEFVIKLQSLMSRLLTVPSPEEQLGRLYRNMHPRYKAYIKRGDFDSVRTLVRLGKDFEQLQVQTALYRSPPPMSQSMVPATAYDPRSHLTPGTPSPSGPNTANPGQVRPKHCYRCGRADVTLKECPNCRAGNDPGSK